MKKLLLACMMAYGLSAWADAIPPNANQWAKQSVQQSSNLVKKSETRIIGYYDAKGKQVKSPARNGFYRTLLGRDAQGRAVIQDYYQDSRTKQIDPVVIPNEKDINNFNANVAEGFTTWYSPTGEVTEFVEINNGELRQRGVYKQGQLVHLLQIEGKQDHLTFYYPNGKIMADIHQNNDNDEQHSFFYDEKGKLIYDSKKDKDISESDPRYEKIGKITMRILSSLEETIDEN